MDLNFVPFDPPPTHIHTEVALDEISTNLKKPFHEPDGINLSQISRLMLIRSIIVSFQTLALMSGEIDRRQTEKVTCRSRYLFKNLPKTHIFPVLKRHSTLKMSKMFISTH